MYLLHTIPIASGIAREHLTYFTSIKTTEGAIVNVPIRKKIAPAVVVFVQTIASAKTNVKQSEFVIKKIDSFAQKKFFLPQFVSACRETAEYFLSSTGAVLFQAVPKNILDSISDITPPGSYIPSRLSNKRTAKNEKLILQEGSEVRLIHYRNLIREAFARNESLFILTATVREAEYIASRINKGIKEHVIVLHGELSKKEMLSRFNTAVSDPHPLCIIATGMFLSLPRPDIGTIIVERESAYAYKLKSRPFLDMRTFASIYAAHLNIRLILADMPLSVEILYRHQKGEFDELAPKALRATSKASQIIIDMRHNSTDTNKDVKKTFESVSSELVKLIENSGQNERTFIFNARRGIAPTTVCEECGNAVMCKNCSAPVVLHRERRENTFVCHKCGSIRSAKERCRVCKSWKLKPLGIGTQRVRLELKKKLPLTNVFVLDSDTVKTSTQALTIVKKFYSTEGSVLIGTEMSLPYLNDPITYTAVTSIDSLLSLPDPKVYERVFFILLKIRAMTQKTFLVQSRQPELPLLRYGLEGNLNDFYRSELKQRKQFNYPPFSTLIKITAVGTLSKTISEMEKIKKLLDAYEVTIYPAFTPLMKGKYSLHGLLKIPSERWPDKKLRGLLRALPLYISVDVNPLSIL
ncbi:hypothetical protein IID27_01955 [Patescibacteria group bacterium]|nr:hypothetical protein [Patescibacteria group bacterium]